MSKFKDFIRLSFSADQLKQLADGDSAAFSHPTLAEDVECFKLYDEHRDEIWALGGLDTGDPGMGTAAECFVGKTFLLRYAAVQCARKLLLHLLINETETHNKKIVDALK